MNNYKELIDRLTNGTDMPGYDEGDALDWYSHITDEAADAIKQLVAGRDELVAALEKIADTDPDEGTVWFHSIADSTLAKVGAGKTEEEERCLVCGNDIKFCICGTAP